MLDRLKFDFYGIEPLAVADLVETIAGSVNTAMAVGVSTPTRSRLSQFGQILERFLQRFCVGFQFARDRLLNPLDLAAPACLAALSRRTESIYLLQLLPRHRAMDFVRSKYCLGASLA